jgi:hypothetical protein
MRKLKYHKLFVLFGLFGVSNSFCQQNISGQFIIKGKINIPFTGVAILHYYDYVQNQYKRDSALIRQQQFQIKGFLKEPTYATLYLKRDNNNIKDTISTAYFLLIEPAMIHLEAGKIVNDVIVNGSVSHNDYVEFLERDKSFQRSEDSIQMMIHRSKGVSDTLTVGKLNKALNQLRQKQCSTSYSKMVIEKRNSIFSIFILQRMLKLGYDKNKLRELFLQLTPRIQNTNAANDLKKFI